LKESKDTTPDEVSKIPAVFDGSHVHTQHNTAANYSEQRLITFPRIASQQQCMHQETTDEKKQSKYIPGSMADSS